VVVQSDVKGNLPVCFGRLKHISGSDSCAIGKVRVSSTPLPLDVPIATMNMEALLATSMSE
jgi:hypothetical protein